MTHPLSLQELRQFSGDDQRYRHAINRRVIYTPGIQYLAEKAGAYWLIDAIAIHIGSKPMQRKMALDPRAGEMLFWSLTVKPDQSAHLTAVVDQDVSPIFRERIQWTDFPLDKIDIWSAFDGQYWTLYLPSEH